MRVAGALATLVTLGLLAVFDQLWPLSFPDVLTLVVLLLFLGALIPVLASVDYALLWAELQSARPGLFVASVILGQVAFHPAGYGNDVRRRALHPFAAMAVLHRRSPSSRSRFQVWRAGWR